MLLEESMAVEPSADQGNVPAMDETPLAPSEQQPAPEPQAPEAPPVEEPAPPADPAEPVLYDLPDGRKVDAETLQREWKENFLPDYTRKSQELARMNAPQPNNSQPENQNPYADPNYIPKSYDEVIAEAEQRVFAKMQQQQEQQAQLVQEVEAKIATQIDTVKQADPTVNIDKVFAHANKYGFDDLVAAHKNMQDMAALVKTAQTETVKNITKRNDPVSGGSQPSGTRPHPSAFTSARDYLDAIKGQA